jgi:antitoxin ParD1/3/4
VSLLQQEETIMETMNISLPEPLRQFVDEQMAEGRYSSVSEYIRELIRADERRKAEDMLEAFLAEGLDSPVIEADEEFWKGFRERALARREARLKKGTNAGC